jgi:hypothetical protein
MADCADANMFLLRTMSNLFKYKSQCCQSHTAGYNAGTQQLLRIIDCNAANQLQLQPFGKLGENGRARIARISRQHNSRVGRRRISPMPAQFDAAQ